MRHPWDRRALVRPGGPWMCARISWSGAGRGTYGQGQVVVLGVDDDVAVADEPDAEDSDDDDVEVDPDDDPVDEPDEEPDLESVL